MVEIRFMVPAEWRDELAAAAAVQAISMADLLRLIVRSFLRNRYLETEQELLK
jgi:hypothetical protein